MQVENLEQQKKKERTANIKVVWFEKNGRGSRYIDPRQNAKQSREQRTKNQKINSKERYTIRTEPPSTKSRTKFGGFRKKNGILIIIHGAANTQCNNNIRIRTASGFSEENKSWPARSFLAKTGYADAAMMDVLATAIHTWRLTFGRTWYIST